jgi:hypothetical protein
MASPALVPDPACLRLLRLEADQQTIIVVVVTRATEAPCPLCHHPNSRVHSRYTRRVADLRLCDLRRASAPTRPPILL